MSDPFFPEPLSPEEERRVLGRDLEESKGFSLNFVLTNQAPARAKHIAALREEHPALNLVEIHLSEPVRSFIDLLRQQKSDPLPAAFLIYGIEEWVSSKDDGNQIPFFRNLNAARNSFLKEFPCSFVFWVPEWLLGKFLQGCPDFISIRNGIYQVAGDAGEERLVLMEQLSTPSMNAVYAISLNERASRAEELESLLAELESEPTEQQDQDAILQILDSLSVIYYTTAQYEKAEPLLKRTLSIRENFFGMNHPETAGGVNNLAEFYRSKGDYTSALPLYERALDIYKTTTGEDNPECASVMNNLALLYQSKGDYFSALPLYTKALAIRESILGVNNSDTAQSLNNLALLYDIQGDNDSAIPLYERALVIREGILDADHPDIAQILNNIAGVYHSKGDYVSAMSFYKRALVICEKSLGENHPQTAQALNNLAVLFHNMDKDNDALPLMVRAFKIRYEKLGRMHSQTQSTLRSLLMILKKLNMVLDIMNFLPFLEKST